MQTQTPTQTPPKTKDTPLLTAIVGYVLVGALGLVAEWGFISKDSISGWAVELTPCVTALAVAGIAWAHARFAHLSFVAQLEHDVADIQLILQNVPKPTPGSNTSTASPAHMVGPLVHPPGGRQVP